jgi:hypothetical protein
MSGDDSEWGWSVLRTVGIILFCWGALFAIGWIIWGLAGALIMMGAGIVWTVGCLIYYGWIKDRS